MLGWILLAFIGGALFAFGLGFNVGYHKRQWELDQARREKWTRI